jgi:hypothetical protein
MCVLNAYDTGDGSMYKPGAAITPHWLLSATGKPREGRTIQQFRMIKNARARSAAGARSERVSRLPQACAHHGQRDR